ncbi:hypothetical protein DFQ28_004235 [Apophysomyces sp. BC1034]|nr:hypothetical protein DFQ30_005368 [Apophysomyces sp. BC1015]KAG0178524.1 hypothetical protein DFQ29_003337 [Apophysomyces sp. BC1021]KAG0188862.1 hypothetical protein DFQ28_004235 [Apophysomyces sp. BC1034]
MASESSPYSEDYAISPLSSYTILIDDTLSVNDLLHPTETAESLLETLTTEQLNVIERALNKIKEKKLGAPTMTEAPTPPPPSPPSQTDLTNTVTTTSFTDISQPWASAATQVAKALVDAISSTNKEFASLQPVSPGGTSAAAKPPDTGSTTTSTFLPNHEPMTEFREGVEWVSFVYSHHRTLRRYCIRTDLEKVDIDLLDEKFKKDNCVYPRANLPRETYRGNRWAYETECNVLGWKLAYLNNDEIAGKRGLIQRAVDSYRNRYPSMRSRRVARQEKLLKGTLRKRKHRERDEYDTTSEPPPPPEKLVKSCMQSLEPPKTMTVEGQPAGTKYRIRINIESVALESIDMAFREANCVFPRAMHINTSDLITISQRRLDEARCNEIGWKLAWLNPRQLANKKNSLQQVLDTYRSQYAPGLSPRKYSSRVPPAPFAPPRAITYNNNSQIPLTTKALEEQQQQFIQAGQIRRNSDQSCYTGTTATLDFNDCFSPPSPCQATDEFDPSPIALITEDFLKGCELSQDESTSCSSRNPSNNNSPSPSRDIHLIAAAAAVDDMYQQALLINSATSLFDSVDNTLRLLKTYDAEPMLSADIGMDFCDQVDIKYEDVGAGIDDFPSDPLLSQLF